MLRATEFWCSVCDHNIVNSSKPETGKFYSVRGHQRSKTIVSGQSVIVETDGEYTEVFFAICPDCKLEDALIKWKELSHESSH